MKIRNSLLLMPVALVLAGRQVRAEDCTLSGVTVAKDGTAVPGVQVMVSGYRMFRAGTYKNITSGSDGTFTVANLPCGKYMVNAIQRGFDYTANPGYVIVDIKKQPKVQLILPKVDRLAAMLRAPDAPEFANGEASPGTGAGRAEDPAISQLRRQYFERINASQLAAFDGAPNAEQKRMYRFAFATYLAGIAGGDASLAEAVTEVAKPSKKPNWRAMVGGRGQADEMLTRTPGTRLHREEDSTAKRQLANAAAIVRQRLPAEDASIFGRGPEMEQARLFLRAVTALPQHQSQCGMYSLWAVDSEDVSQIHNANRSYMPFLDDTGPAARWAELDTASKCKLIDASALKVIAQRLDPAELGPKHTVLQMFGNDGLAKYEQSKSTDQQLELYRASLIMELCWYAAYTAL
jgi:Carboxypeptidase regulatory-like domain